MTDPLLPPETFSDAMDEAARVCETSAWGGHPPTSESSGLSEPRGTLTIDKELPPVDAAPKPKGPAWRLWALRAWRRGQR